MEVKFGAGLEAILIEILSEHNDLDQSGKIKLLCETLKAYFQIPEWVYFSCPGEKVDIIYKIEK